MLGGGGAAFAVASLDPEPSTVVVRQVLDRCTIAGARSDRSAGRAQLQAVPLGDDARQRHGGSAAGPAGRRGSPGGFVPAHRSDVPRTGTGARRPHGHRRGQRQPRFGQTQRTLGSRRRWHLQTPRDRAHAADRFVSRVETARWSPPPAWAAAPCALRCSPPPTRHASPMAWSASSSRSSPATSISTARCNAATASTWCTRPWRRTAKPCARPRPLGRVRQQGHAAPGHVVRGAGPQGRLLHAGRQEPDTSYLASPMEFSRVTSGFEMRFHPILHSWQAHWAWTTAPLPEPPSVPWATASSNSRASRTASARW